MRKTATRSGDPSILRSIPSVDRVLNEPEMLRLAEAFGRTAVKEALGDHLNTLRRERRTWNPEVAVASVEAAAGAATALTLRRVVNGTGVIIHTNLGRSPIDGSLLAESAALLTHYANLEMDLESGGRGARDEHLSGVCRTLFGCEAAILVNNNASATLLLLAAVAAGKSVLISRGELVEIGGSFRIPEVIQQGGARLREVGTTNRTRASDYDEGFEDSVAAILRVHRSNFEIVGFTETPGIGELAAVARSRGIPLLYDEGSGRIVDLTPYGFMRQPSIRELIEAGVDAICCSTDKLIGATQGGLILGRHDLIDRCRRHPLMRALRAGKESYATIGATLRSFARGRHEREIPIYRMLATPLEVLHERAVAIATKGWEIAPGRSVLGGGTTATESIETVTLRTAVDPPELHRRFLQWRIPIAGRIADDQFTIDMRTLLDDDVSLVAEAVREITG